MKVIAIVVAALVIAAVLILVYLAGVAHGMHRNFAERLSELGLTRRTATLYNRAAKILNRLDQLTDLDGQMAGDVLSPETKSQVRRWMTDHRNEVNKV